MKKKILWGVLAVLAIFIFRFVQYVYYMNKAVFGTALFPYFKTELLTNFQCGAEQDTEKIKKELMYYKKAEKIHKEPFLYSSMAADYLSLDDLNSAGEANKNVIRYIDNYPLFEKTLALATFGFYSIADKNEYKTIAALNLLTGAMLNKNYDLCIEVSDYLLPSAYYEKAVCEYNSAKYNEALKDFESAREYEIKKLKESSQNPSSSPKKIQNQEKRIKVINAYIKLLS
ncbi:MAG: hypothetical protein LUG16_06300 [Candidatus Gastranaerophilales bacterium]|nr:hypothetical protein [Candidatus Gastranaerophilales bacterium]